MRTPGKANRLARLLHLLADPARARVLVAMDELCVGDLALDIAADQSTYALEQLDHCPRQLLSISNQENHR